MRTCGIWLCLLSFVETVSWPLWLENKSSKSSCNKKVNSSKLRLFFEKRKLSNKEFKDAKLDPNWTWGKELMTIE